LRDKRVTTNIIGNGNINGHPEPKDIKPRSERYYSCPIWISIGFPSIHPSALIVDGRVDKITTVQRAEPIAAAQCVTAAECCSNANVPNATSIDRTYLTSRAIGVGVAIWEASTWRCTVDTEPCASGGAGADTRTTWPALPKSLACLARAAGSYTRSVGADAGGTLLPTFPAVLWVIEDVDADTRAQLFWKGANRFAYTIFASCFGLTHIPTSPTIRVIGRQIRAATVAERHTTVVAYAGP